MRIHAEFNGARIVVSDEWGILVEMPDGCGWVMGCEEWKVHDVIYEWVASLLDDAKDARKQERARAVEIVDHFFMDRETEQRIKSAITDGGVCACPSESCPIAFGD